MNAAHSLTCIAVLSLLSLTACGKKDDATGTTTTTGTTTAAATGAKHAKATLKLADYRAAYKAQMDDFSKMKDPMDKRIGAVVAKVGAPESDDGKRKTWHAIDGNDCWKVQLDDKDGSNTESQVDKSECGL